MLLPLISDLTHSFRTPLEANCTNAVDLSQCMHFLNDKGFAFFCSPVCNCVFQPWWTQQSWISLNRPSLSKTKQPAGQSDALLYFCRAKLQHLLRSLLTSSTLNHICLTLKPMMGSLEPVICSSCNIIHVTGAPSLPLSYRMLGVAYIITLFTDRAHE